MHGSLESNHHLVTGLLNQELDIELVVCPPSVYLGQLAVLAGQSELRVGAQDVSEHEQGAYTGETSAAMLAEMSCQYCLVGHSERRQYHRETNDQVMAKAKRLQASGIVPVICVGETLEQREDSQTLSVIGEQLANLGQLDCARVVVAYEPVWAIGTGKVATAEQAQDVHQFIRRQLGEHGQTTRILYGGSVKPDNASDLFAQEDIDGALVGGASLKAEDFLSIARCAMKNA